MGLLDNIITVTDLQRQASKFIDQAKKEPVVITQRGRPTALLVDAQMYRAMAERLCELEDQEMVRMIEAASKEFEAGRGIPHDEAVARLRAAWQGREG